MDDKLSEVRNILSGLVAYDNGIVVEATTVFELKYQGMYAGTAAARVFGIVERKRTYRFRAKIAEVPALCEKAFTEMGQLAYLRTVPDALGVMLYPPLQNPCLMTVELRGSGQNKGREVELTFYAARTPLCLWNAHRRFRSWEKKLPEGVAERIGEDGKPVRSRQTSQKKK